MICHRTYSKQPHRDAASHQCTGYGGSNTELCLHAFSQSHAYMQHQAHIITRQLQPLRSYYNPTSSDPTFQAAYNVQLFHSPSQHASHAHWGSKNTLYNHCLYNHYDAFKPKCGCQPVLLPPCLLPPCAAAQQPSSPVSPAAAQLQPDHE
jgi:hypothetical protein